MNVTIQLDNDDILAALVKLTPVLEQLKKSAQEMLKEKMQQQTKEETNGSGTV